MSHAPTDGDTVGCTIEVLERHPGERMPDVGTGAVVAPNTLRINGSEIWQASDHPIGVGPIELALRKSLIVVPVTMLARVAEGDPDAVFPPLDDGMPAAPTVAFDLNVVRLNGAKVWVDACGVEVLHRHVGTDYARVRIHLIARTLIIGDQPHQDGPFAGLHPHAHPKGVLVPSVAAAQALLALAQQRAANAARAGAQDVADAQRQLTGAHRAEATT